ncbi:toprim domain-containing protein [Chryseobacterium sp. 18068]|uniref:toprim domain-containing protein n=1 Tax=Chryseobacterium sp. 18068 TaxID=2681414 RepID=UPI00135AF77C|nr:toprim domain-containing protein [Chryseobacterium sp. 18068]
MENNKFYDWEKAISEIDLIDYFTHKFPNFYWDNQRKAFVDNPNSSLRTDKFVFFKGKDGKQNYLSRASGNGGNLIHFIKNEICRGNTNWTHGVNEELSKLYPLLETLKKHDYKKEIDHHKIFENNISKEFQISGKLLNLHSSQKDYITGFRQISDNTLNSLEFLHVVKTYQPQDNKYYCIGIPLYNTKEDVVGVNRIFTYEKSDLFNEKKFLPGSDNRIGFSKSNTLIGTDTFIIGEGIFDGMAHYEIFKPKNSEYLFSNGELGRSKVAEMLKYIEGRNVNKIVFANDNDVKGNYFNLLFLSYIIPNLKLKSVNNKSINISITDGDFVNMINVNKMCDYFLNKNNKIVNAISENKGNENMLEISDLFIFSRKNNTTEIDISLPNQKEFLEEFNNFIPNMFVKQDLHFSICKPISKDFNDDLKIHHSILSNEKNLDSNLDKEVDNNVSR